MNEFLYDHTGHNVDIGFHTVDSGFGFQTRLYCVDCNKALLETPISRHFNMKPADVPPHILRAARAIVDANLIDLPADYWFPINKYWGVHIFCRGIYRTARLHHALERNDGYDQGNYVCIYFQDLTDLNEPYDEENFVIKEDE